MRQAVHIRTGLAILFVWLTAAPPAFSQIVIGKNTREYQRVGEWVVRQRYLKKQFDSCYAKRDTGAPRPDFAFTRTKANTFRLTFWPTPDFGNQTAPMQILFDGKVAGTLSLPELAGKKVFLVEINDQVRGAMLKAKRVGIARGSARMEFPLKGLKDALKVFDKCLAEGAQTPAPEGGPMMRPAEGWNIGVDEDNLCYAARSAGPADQSYRVTLRGDLIGLHSLDISDKRLPQAGVDPVKVTLKLGAVAIFTGNAILFDDEMSILDIDGAALKRVDRAQTLTVEVADRPKVGAHALTDFPSLTTPLGIVAACFEK